MLRRMGHSLIELTYALLILTILVGIATRSLMRARDAIAVQAAASVLAAELSRCRTLAVLHGGAQLMVDLRQSRVRVIDGAGDPLTTWVEVGRAHGVRLSVSSGADTIRLRFDARGLGQMTSASFGLRRGVASAGIVVSAYGRQRQW